MAANRDDGTTLRSPSGTCLARYRIEHDLLTFSIDDDCMLEQLSVILPEVAAYESGLLDFLLRGELAITVSDQITVSGAGLGAGNLEILVEDERGVRTSVTKVATNPTSAPPAAAAGAAAAAPNPEPLAKAPSPTSGTRVVAVYRGVDADGEPIVAVGAMPLTH
jgi:hypothetical protein